MAEKVERRLAAILAMDVVGFSTMMAANETDTLAHLQTLRDELIDPTLAVHRGRVVKLMGDGALVEFASIVDAVQCAVEVQRLIDERNQVEAEADRIDLRIGINLGDVIVDGDDIYGDGVNIAARLEPLSEPGGIVLSASAFEQAKNKVDIPFEDLGPQQLKNIPEPVRAYSITPNSLGAAGAAPTRPNIQPRQTAIAVLPFANLSGEREQEYFADGLTEDIITALSAWRTFSVISRNSAFTYKNQAVKVQQVADELGVRYVLEGSVRKGGDRVRISAQLIDADTGHHVWADKFDRDLSDIFEVQDEITKRIAATVAPELEMVEHQRGAGRRTTSLQAWDHYQRGMAAWRKFDREANEQAREMFERAIELDPSYAQAYSGLAATYNAEAWARWAVSRGDAAECAVAAGKQAVVHDPADASIRVTLGIALILAGEFEHAIDELRRALELNPNNAFAYVHLGQALDAAGKPTEAVETLETAVRYCPPRDLRTDIAFSLLARAHLGARQYEQSVDWARKAVGRRSGPDSYITLASSLGHLGRLEEARTALDECEKAHPGRIQKEFNVDPCPYQNRADHQHILDGLRKAGWKD